MPVTAIIPTWNRRELVCSVIADLHRQTHPPQTILIVDNGSTDGAAAACERLGATVLPMGRNAGFAAAVNRGVQTASTQWVAILNNDVQLHPDWLKRLVSHASESGAHYAGGKLLRASDPSQLDGGFDLLCRGGCPWRAGEGRPDGALWNQPRPIHFLPFTAALFQRGLFDEIGPLDESFESYLEDVDFGLRCALVGKRGVYVPDALAYHVGSATFGAWSPRTVRLLARNQVLLAAKYGMHRENRWPVLLSQGLWGLLALRHGRGWAWIEGNRQGRTMASTIHNQPNERLRQILRDSEDELRSLQQQTGFDMFWRLYFSLT